MKKIILLVIVLFACLAHADDRLILNPNKTECRLENTEYEAYKSVNVYYLGGIIHRGRGTSEEFSNGDMLKCRSVVESARAAKASIILNRSIDNEAADWYKDGFFTIDANSSCSY